MNNYKVYIHKFPNGKAYIGITRQEPKIRWGGGNGYVRNEYMHRAIKKYGWENIEHIILFDGLSEEDANHLSDGSADLYWAKGSVSTCDSISSCYNPIHIFSTKIMFICHYTSCSI